ncbi:uncharacterized protein LOC112463095 [Temnothorax curvispinosus]|uniref:Uncharacterized protein LOC112463095 n=1 Tax=Temnothorax curvispinosus TaxID=300111 RepID=A0A6J1QWN1_9HYME|nr:uncharacterized protein LOC112463095 [Temnothorax curvispinosus]
MLEFVFNCNFRECVRVSIMDVKREDLRGGAGPGRQQATAEQPRDRHSVTTQLHLRCCASYRLFRTYRRTRKPNRRRLYKWFVASHLRKCRLKPSHFRVRQLKLLYFGSAVLSHRIFG